MKVAVIIPTLNEAAHIRTLLSTLLLDADRELLAILVVDGGSTDGTLQIVGEMMISEPRVRLLANRKRIQAAGCNLAAIAAGDDADAIVRIDAHARYPKHFVRHVSDALQRTGAESVVVRLKSEGCTRFQRAVAFASNSRWGTGGSAHRVGGTSGWVDHGHHAGFRRTAFLGAGGYDEAFDANEDAEFDSRVRRAGGRIWFAAEIEVTYYPRAHIVALSRQYFRYGRGRARTVLKSGEWPRLRQLAAPTLVPCLAASTVASVWHPQFLVVVLGYCGTLAFVGMAAALQEARPGLLYVPAALAAMHLSWGSGFLTELLRRLFQRPARTG